MNWWSIYLKNLCRRHSKKKQQNQATGFSVSKHTFKLHHHQHLMFGVKVLIVCFPNLILLNQIENIYSAGYFGLKKFQLGKISCRYLLVSKYVASNYSSNFPMCRAKSRRGFSPIWTEMTRTNSTALR